jgi:cytochrome c-type biogenesis protein CcmE
MNTKQNAGKIGAGKWPVLLTAGALAVAPFLNPIAVHAAPKNPTWDDRNYKVHVNPTDNYRYNNVGNVTISGVVVNDLAGNQFTLRANDGRTYRVTTNRKEPGWLTNGDRVTVQGRINSGNQNLIVASSVTQSNGSGGIGNGVIRNVTIAGVVLSDLEGNEFNMRANDGHIYRVVTTRNEPGWLSNGDTVTVQGRIESSHENRIIATNVTHPGGGNVGNGVGAGQSITVSGVVTRDPAGNQFTLRADDGRTYRVITNNQEPGWLTNGDRVTVRGRTESRDRTLIIATSVVQQGNTSNSGGLSVNLSGVVTRDPVGNQFTFRADDGRTYRVITNNQEPGWLTVGDRVTVQGRVDARDRTFIIATNVTHPNGTSGNGLGQSISMQGVVTRDRAGNQFTFRSDAGQTYRVTTTNREPGWLTNGDRVLVRGRLDARDRDLIIATSVDHAAGTASSTSGGDLAVNFWGRVELVTNNGLIRSLRVRGDNGGAYAVTYRNLSAFRVGDRVHVIGTSHNGVVTASSISR